MTLSAGSRLGPYEVLSPIGAGGMGQVFKARDTRLGRSVAIKVLPAEFADNPQLRLRFEREAKTISQLSHPNICALFDVGENYLVMELLEGETLAERIARGALPLEQVLRYGMQIAEALDRAHKAGIVHRDLKPGNVMLTRSGAKLLDFGLAKSAPAAAAAQGNVTELKPITEEGAIVGTVQYMAPEQLEGLDADARTDIFALGQILYEMLTGRRAFIGKTRTSLVAAIMAAQPERIVNLQPLTPASLEAVIVRCLEKEPNERFQCAADLRWALARVDQERSALAAVRPQRRVAAAWLIAAVALAGAAVAILRATRLAAPPASVAKFTFDPPPGWIAVTELKSGPPAISPDGRSIVFVGTDALTGRRMLWLRRIDDVTPRTLEGTDDASRPFWSPDGRSVAFFADNNGKLKRVDIAGGPAQMICSTQNGRGGAWGPNGDILFAAVPYSSLVRVDAGGGTPTPATTLDATAQETSHRWPSFLPDGKRFFYVARRDVPTGSTAYQDRIYVHDPDSGKSKFILEASSNIQYCDAGLVAFTRDRTLFAQKFDLGTLQVVGAPIPIVSQLQFHPSGFGMFTLSTSTLVYQAGTIATHLELYDRATDKSVPLLEAGAEYALPRFSPDQKQIVYDVADPVTGSQDVWLFDRDRKVARRLTTNVGDDFSALLTRDGQRIYFTSNRTGAPQIYWKSIAGGEEKIVHVAPRSAEFSQSLAPDERHLLYVSLGPSQNDVRVLSLVDGSDAPFSASEFDEIQPQFSPDGRYVALASNESGKYEIYIAPFPGGVPHTQISVDGGTQPVWRGDGREIYYVNAVGRLMSVSIDTTGRIEVGAPSAITSVTLRPSRNTMREYDVSADGKTFLLNSTGSGPRSVPFTVVQNWTNDLAR
ncbi:MAG TPA: protein kinase [Thermoanaerobaculia bacterium]|nr:protein kinase [Thermoanaerobaculia bacterium]